VLVLRYQSVKIAYKNSNPLRGCRGGATFAPPAFTLQNRAAVQGLISARKLAAILVSIRRAVVCLSGWFTHTRRQTSSLSNSLIELLDKLLITLHTHYTHYTKHKTVRALCKATASPVPAIRYGGRHDWKEGQVVPIHKKRKSSSVQNYRPITSVVCKMLERLID